MVDVVRGDWQPLPLPLERFPKEDLGKYELLYRLKVTIRWSQILDLLENSTESEDTIDLLGGDTAWRIVECHRPKYRSDHGDYYILFEHDLPFEPHRIGFFLRGIAEMERSYDLLERRRTNGK